MFGSSFFDSIISPVDSEANKNTYPTLEISV